MNKPDYKLPTYDGSLFMWRGCTGMCEASDLKGAERGVSSTWRQVWSDAADIGFFVRSERTGKVKLFTMTDEERADEDIVSWTFRSSDGAQSILIIND